MYDTINLKLSVFEEPNIKFLQTVPNCLDVGTIGEHRFNEEDTVITGSIGNLKIAINRYCVKIKDGSLCKWFLGNNLQTMGRGDTKEAIEKLSDVLHLSMGKAIVSRLDVAENFILKYPVETYLEHLGNLKNAKRLIEPSGLYYVKNGQRLCFYDKNREQRKMGNDIPELYKNRNVLRYEQRYLQRIAAQLKIEKITGATLFDEAFYMDIINNWVKAYKTIEKINDITCNFKEMKTVKQLKTVGLLSYIERNGGEIQMLKQIEEAQKKGELTPKQAYDLRKAIKEACKNDEGLTMENKSTKELDEKIKEAVKYYR